LLAREHNRVVVAQALARGDRMTIHNADLTAVVRERHGFHPGENIRLAPDLTCRFDPATGARVR
jgi:hypothetical protein